MPGIEEIIAEIFSSPQAATSFFIQFFVGGLIGYSVSKAGKYVVMVVIAVILGGVLGVWGTTGISDIIMTELGITPEKLLNLFNVLTSVIGVIGVAPVVIGALIGGVIGLKS